MVSDWWSLGILIYEMLVGIPPFYSENQEIQLKFQKELDVEFPIWLKISDEAKDIIKQLLTKNPKNRIGVVQGWEEIKNHSWFKGFNFNLLKQKRLKSPFCQ